METLFFHGKTTDGKRFTIAGKPNANGFTVAASLCSKNDLFVKKIGRAKAAGRLESNLKHVEMVVDTTDHGTTAFINKMKEFNLVKSRDFQLVFNLNPNNTNFTL